MRILAAQWRRSVVSLTIIPTNQITVIVMFPWKQKPDNREKSNLFVFCALKKNHYAIGVNNIIILSKLFYDINCDKYSMTLLVFNF